MDKPLREMALLSRLVKRSRLTSRSNGAIANGERSSIYAPRLPLSRANLAHFVTTPLRLRAGRFPAAAATARSSSTGHPNFHSRGIGDMNGLSASPQQNRLSGRQSRGGGGGGLEVGRGHGRRPGAGRVADRRHRTGRRSAAERRRVVVQHRSVKRDFLCRICAGTTIAAVPDRPRPAYLLEPIPSRDTDWANKHAPDGHNSK